MQVPWRMDLYNKATELNSVRVIYSQALIACPCSSQQRIADSHNLSLRKLHFAIIIIGLKGI